MIFEHRDKIFVQVNENSSFIIDVMAPLDEFGASGRHTLCLTEVALEWCAKHLEDKTPIVYRFLDTDGRHGRIHNSFYGVEFSSIRDAVLFKTWWT